MFSLHSSYAGYGKLHNLFLVDICTCPEYPIHDFKKFTVLGSCLHADLASSGGSGIFSLQCTLPTYDKIPRSVLETLTGVISPFLVALLFSSIWALVAFVKKKSWIYLLHHWHAVIISVFYFSYINVTRILLRIFTCTYVDEEGENLSIATFRYWVEDPDLKCYEGTHLVLVLAVGVPLLLLISIGMPFGLLVVFMLECKGLIDRRYLWHYSFLYTHYRVEFRYWEVLVMLRKALMAAVAVFAFPLGPDLQALLALGILVIAFGAHVLKMPLVVDGPSLNRLEGVSLSCSYLIFFMALVFNDPNTSPAGKFAVSVILIGALVGVTLYFVIALMGEVSKGINVMLLDNGIEVQDNTTLFKKVVLLLELALSRIVGTAKEWVGRVVNTRKR